MTRISSEKRVQEKKKKKGGIGGHTLSERGGEGRCRKGGFHLKKGESAHGERTGGGGKKQLRMTGRLSRVSGYQGETGYKKE